MAGTVACLSFAMLLCNGLWLYLTHQSPVLFRPSAAHSVRHQLAWTRPPSLCSGQFEVIARLAET